MGICGKISEMKYSLCFEYQRFIEYKYKLGKKVQLDGKIYPHE